MESGASASAGNMAEGEDGENNAEGGSNREMSEVAESGADSIDGSSRDLNSDDKKSSSTESAVKTTKIREDQRVINATNALDLSAETKTLTERVAEIQKPRKSIC